MATKDQAPVILGTWNAHGVAQYTSELKYFVDKHDMSVLMLTETYLKPGDCFNLRGIQVFRKDRTDGRRGGGVAVCIRAKYSAKECNLESNIETASAETKIGGRMMVFTAAY